jgi:hypothetical protein
LAAEGGRWTVDQFKHPLMVMVNGGWWMVICEKKLKIYPKFSQTYFLSKYFKYLIYLNIFLLKNHWKNDKTDDDHV